MWAEHCLQSDTFCLYPWWLQIYDIECFDSSLCLLAFCIESMYQFLTCLLWGVELYSCLRLKDFLGWVWEWICFFPPTFIDKTSVRVQAHTASSTSQMCNFLIRKFRIKSSSKSSQKYHRSAETTQVWSLHPTWHPPLFNNLRIKALVYTGQGVHVTPSSSGPISQS